MARETVAIHERAAAERAQWQQEGLDDARRANVEERFLARIDAAQPDRHRYIAQASWTDPDGGTLTESRSFATEHTATEWLQGRIHGTSWAEGTTLYVETRDTHNAAKQYTDRGRPETVVGWLAAREAVLRERTLTGQVHREDIRAAREVENRDQVAQQDREPEQPSADLRFNARVAFLPEGADRVVYEYGAHASEADAAAWIQQQVAQARPAPGTTVQVAAYEESSEGRSDSLFRAVGRREEVAGDLTQWRVDIANVAADRERPQNPQHEQRSEGDRLAAIERQLSAVGADRDKLSNRVEILQRGLDAVTADRDEIRKSLAAAQGRIEELKNRNIRLASEIGELRDRPDAAQVIGERDRYKRERDEAVAKLHARTPAKDRYGSAEKVAHERLGDTQAWPAPERPTGAQRNGNGRNGIDRSR
ncbi:hypothetical protein [Nocardia xishanensis]|uniref:Uncharacterized protein n=1 Tax=Nocardia xishanensis TaxID=238964 RepID=A0ABW7WX85_9NOCA